MIWQNETESISTNFVKSTFMQFKSLFNFLIVFSTYCKQCLLQMISLITFGELQSTEVFSFGTTQYNMLLHDDVFITLSLEAKVS